MKWHIDEDGTISHPKMIAIRDQDGDPVALIDRAIWKPQAQKELSALVAAAPDLLESLKELVDIVQGVLDGDVNTMDSFTLQPAQAAIAKATSQSNDSGRQQSQ